MNETDYLRQQLAAERAHLREILEAVHCGSATAGHLRPVTAYVDWAGQRLLHQMTSHATALAGLGGNVAIAQLSRVTAAAATVAAQEGRRPLGIQPERLLALLDAWTEAMDALAGKSLRVGYWRQAAQLSADSVLEERQRYAAARLALGLS